MSETCHKLANIDEKMTQNRFKKCTFSFYFLDKPLPLKKNEKRYFILHYKNKNTRQFHAFTIKNDFGNMSKGGQFFSPLRNMSLFY